MSSAAFRASKALLVPFDEAEIAWSDSVNLSLTESRGQGPDISVSPLRGADIQP